MNRQGARQNQFRLGILRRQADGLHCLVDRRPLRIVGRELRQIGLARPVCPAARSGAMSIRFLKVDRASSIWPSASCALPIMSSKAGFRGNFCNASVAPSSAFSASPRRNRRRASATAMSGLAAAAGTAFSRTVSAAVVMAGFRLEFGERDVGPGAFGMGVQNLLEIAAGFVRFACRQRQPRQRLVRGDIAAPDVAGLQQRLPPFPQLALVQIHCGGQQLADRLGRLGLLQPSRRSRAPGHSLSSA